MYLKNSKIIVVKIGSSLLVDQNKKIRKQWLSSFAKDIKKLRDKNQKVVIVSSGAIALGCKKMNYNKKNIKLDKNSMHEFIDNLKINKEIKLELKKITPYNYTGINYEKN